jgi:predicted metal-dependent hydrolase
MVRQIVLGGISVDVVFKDIKNVHLSVYPPTGRVRISAPSRMSMDTIRVFAISKLGWIRQQQQKLQGQDREPPREYLDRESHYLWGRRYLLKVIEADESPSMEIKHSRLLLRVRPGTAEEKKQALMDAWYREHLKAAVPELIAKWEPILGVHVERFFVQRMKTKWGGCNAEKRTIRLNTELAKKPKECLEYIVVHELVHLLERRHADRFAELMDRCLPHWKDLRKLLNAAPLGQETWSY